MNPTKYVFTVLSRAAQGSLTLTDRLSVLLVPFTTLVLWVTGRRITESVATYIGIAIACTVIAIVFLRFIASTYFVWLSDQQEKTQLHAKLSDERGRRDKGAREIASQEVASLRNELGEHLSRVIICAELVMLPPINESDLTKRAALYIDSFRRCREIISSLSFDVYLRVSSHGLLSLIAELMAKRAGGQNVDELQAKVNAVKKRVFSIIYKVEPNESSEFLAMAEVQSIIKNGLLSKEVGDSSATKEVEGMFTDLQRRFRDDPEITQVLRVELKAAGPSGFAGIGRGGLESMSPEGREALLEIVARRKEKAERENKER